MTFIKKVWTVFHSTIARYPMNKFKPFNQRKLIYTEDGRLLDEYGNAVMMDWETPMMKKSAEIVCRNGGRILNVGFGLGIVDRFIQQQNIDEHWIIEPHIDVYTKMFEDGWHLKPNVKILFGDWQWYFKYLPKFDGIYFDTHEDDYVYFLENTPNILKDDGVFSLFNNPRDDSEGLHMLPHEYHILSQWGDIQLLELQLNFIDDYERQRSDGLIYWAKEWDKYWCPIITKKQKKQYELYKF